MGHTSKSMIRFIPTCVGNTEKILLPFSNKLGSSPRAWGIHPGRQPPPHALRFIPTCVGNTGSTSYYVKVVTVHPHMRGEYPDPQKFVAMATGSSPRAWGILRRMNGNRNVKRFIPTCVGNTGAECPHSGRRPVHPHVRGEYVKQDRQKILLRRFIPTCVGNTPSQAGTCGPTAGSSPRAWGIQPTRLRQGCAMRFIPTCVGNTPSQAGTCGPTAGSSPRAWGIRSMRW